jgi:4-hydroxybenzoyl-CoA thioesterase/acyl-CoA thioester hydrolase
MPAFFRTTRLIEFADTDMAGIVHFSAFFRYMEAAEHALLRILGLSVAMDWEGQTLTFPRVAASCEFLKPARFEDMLDVTARVVRLGNKSVRYAFEFHLKGQLVARGELSSVCCVLRTRGKTLEAVAIPAGIRERLLEEGGGTGEAL